MVAILFGSKVVSADLDPIVIKVCAMPCVSPQSRKRKGLQSSHLYLQGSKFFFSSNGTQLYVLPHQFDLCWDTYQENQFYEGNSISTLVPPRDTSSIKLSFSEYTLNRGLFNQWHDQWWHQVHRSISKCGYLRTRHPALARASDKYHPSLRHRSEAGPFEVYAVAAGRWDISYRGSW